MELNKEIRSPINKRVTNLFRGEELHPILKRPNVLSDYNMFIIFCVTTDSNWVEFEEDFTEGNNIPSPEEVVIKKQLYLRLSEQAKELLKFILCPSEDFEKVITNHSPNYISKSLRKNWETNNSLQKMAIRYYFRYKWGRGYVSKLKKAYAEIYNYLSKSATI